MLILAGVSLNAIIGDNGIITNAQNASFKSGMAVLEEYLQEEYVKYYDDIEKYNNIKQELLASKHDNLFLKDNNRNYIINEGKVYYLINKSSLPEEIRNGLRAGDTTDYAKYTRLIDVYGVSDELKVFYCNTEDNTVYGAIANSNIDISKIKASNINSNTGIKDLITEELTKYSVIPADDGITLYDVNVINDFSIDGATTNTPITDIQALADLKNLKTLTLSNLTLPNLKGLEGCPGLYYIYLRNCKIGDYSALSSVLKLQYLYIYMSENALTETESNTQVSNLGTGLANASGLTKLEYLSISGTEDFVVDKLGKASNSGTGKSNITDISGLASINNSIKNSVLYLSVDNNKNTSIAALEGYNNVAMVNLNGSYSLTSLNGLADTTQLIDLYANSCGLTSLAGLDNSGVQNFTFWSNNQLQSLAGLEKCKSLTSIYAVDCDFRDITALANMTTLQSLTINNNVNLEEISTLSTLTGLNVLKLAGNVNMIEAQVKSALADSGIAAQCGTNFTYPPKYTKYFSAISTWLDYSYETLGVKLTSENTDWINIKNRTNVIGLNLTGQDQLTDDDLQGTLGTMSGLKALVLTGCSNLESIDFITDSGMTLEELDVRSTNELLTDLSPLNDYKNVLKRVIVNNPNIDISGIQPSIKKMYDLRGDAAGYSFYSTSAWAIAGLITLGDLNEYDFSDCTTMTGLVFALHGGGITYFGESYENDLDLSNCLNLKYIKLGYFKSNVLLPSEMTYINLDNSTAVRFSEGMTIDQLELIGSKKALDNLFSNISTSSVNKPVLKELISTRYLTSNWDFMNRISKISLTYLNFNGTGFTEHFTDLSGLDGCTNLEKLILKGVDTLTNLNGIQSCSKLWYLSIETTTLNDISKLSQLTQLKNIRLLNNKYLKDISSLASLTNLQITYNSDGSIYWRDLNLRNNNISDLSPLLGLIQYSSESDTIGKINFYGLLVSDNIIEPNVTPTNSNIETLIKLKNAGLKELDISGNNITREQGKPLVEAFGNGLTITFADDE